MKDLWKLAAGGTAALSLAFGVDFAIREGTRTQRPSISRPDSVYHTVIFSPVGPGTRKAVRTSEGVELYPCDASGRVSEFPDAIISGGKRAQEIAYNDPTNLQDSGVGLAVIDSAKPVVRRLDRAMDYVGNEEVFNEADSVLAQVGT